MSSNRPGSDESPNASNVPGAVVIVTGEDGIGDTIRPRLEEAGADLRKVRVIQKIHVVNEKATDGYEVLPTIPGHLTKIEMAIRHMSARLLVIDPIVAHLGNEINSWRDQDVRRALTPLAVMAENLGVAVLVIRHLTKQRGGNPLYRGGGSIGFIGAARIGLLLGRSPDGDGTIVLASTKANLSRLPESLALRIVSSENDPNVGVVEWLGRSIHSANDVINVDVPRPTPQRDAAVAWLIEELGNGEWRPASEMFELGKAAGHSKRTINRAKKNLGVKSKQFKIPGKWHWRLPTKREVHERGDPTPDCRDTAASPRVEDAEDARRRVDGNVGKNEQWEDRDRLSGGTLRIDHVPDCHNDSNWHSDDGWRAEMMVLNAKEGSF